MKRILPILVIGVLLVGGFGAVGADFEQKNSDENLVKSTSFTSTVSSLTVEKNIDEYVGVNLEGVTTYLMTPGKPMLPKIVESVELPFGAKNINVKVTPINEREYDLTADVSPAPIHIPLIATTNDIKMQPEKDEAVYTSSEKYPSDWCSVRVSSGLNGNKVRVTDVTTHIYAVRCNPGLKKLYVPESFTIEITYEEPDDDILFKNGDEEFDMVIIAPEKFSEELGRLITHKNNFEVFTFLKTTEEIYDEYSGVDKPEQIKYFIKDAIETYNISYVLLVGGLKSIIYGKPRDNPNEGSKWWHVPVRYANLFDNPEHPLTSSDIHDPGVICDLYYADIYEEGGGFSDWDPNEDGIFAAWGRPGVENDTGIDLEPDIAIGRLACRNNREVRDVVDKIINYERRPCDPSWFNRAISISGDGFLDQEDLDIQWDTKTLPDGEYTIYAQSFREPNVGGPVDVIQVTLDKQAKTLITINHDDHLKTDTYPFFPIVEITSPSNGDILGKNDFFQIPSEGQAYCNEFNGWANLEYTDGVMYIRGKSYDPRPYGNVTDLHLWIENEDEDIVYETWKYDLEMYYEGEWVAGDRLLKGGGGALYYLPDNFYRDIVWASNGRLNGQPTVIDALSKGAGFAFLSGHGSPNSWGDHYPGVPGNRGHGSVGGLAVIQAKPWPKYIIPPVFPMEKITNYDKLPVILIGGCHNSQFNVSMVTSFMDAMPSKLKWLAPRHMWTYGFPVPECFSWYLVKMPRKGAIATIGNTGLGYGTLGKDCTIGGLDGGICIEFFKQYGQNEFHVLGDAYTQALISYVKTFDMEEDDHVKSVQQWALLGDPSLMIGGYP